MKFFYFFAIVLALIAAVVGECPAKFKLDEHKQCTAERPIHGECPAGSTYKANYNKCVYGS